MKKLITVMALIAVAGCGTFERADPSARSARASYTFGNIQATGSSTIRIVLGDGAMAAADGDGTISQPTTTTTSVPTTFQTPAALDPVSLGIQAIANLAGKGIDAYAANQQAKAAAQKTEAKTDAKTDAKAECEGDDCGTGCKDCEIKVCPECGDK